jgi:hypothetical protein
VSREADGFGDAEVHHHRFALVQHHILGLDVAVDDLLAMRVVEGRSNGARVVHRFVNGELMFAIQSLAKRLALYVGHHVIKEAVCFPGIVQSEDVRMVETRRDFYFAEKTIRPERRGKLRMQHLESDHTLVLAVLSEIDGRHAPAAKLAVDGVRIGQRAAEALDRKSRCHMTCSNALYRGKSLIDSRSGSLSIQSLRA